MCFKGTAFNTLFHFALVGTGIGIIKLYSLNTDNCNSKIIEKSNTSQANTLQANTLQAKAPQAKALQSNALTTMAPSCKTRKETLYELSIKPIGPY